MNPNSIYHQLEWVYPGLSSWISNGIAKKNGLEAEFPGSSNISLGSGPCQVLPGAWGFIVCGSELWLVKTTITHDGSMVLQYMVTWIPSIYPKCLHIYQHHGSYGLWYHQWVPAPFPVTPVTLTLKDHGRVIDFKCQILSGITFTKPGLYQGNIKRALKSLNRPWGRRETCSQARHLVSWIVNVIYLEPMKWEVTLW